MRVAHAVRALFETAGWFAIPLTFLALATFAIAWWTAMRLRDVARDPAHGGARDVTRALRLLGAAASSAPLVGLLGTVHGLIVLFSGLQRSGAFDRDLMSKGVGQALFTTEFGLAIAVPALVLHAILQRSLRVQSGALAGARQPRRRRRR